MPFFNQHNALDSKLIKNDLKVEITSEKKAEILKDFFIELNYSFFPILRLLVKLQRQKILKKTIN